MTRRLLIEGGRVLDPAHGLDAICDVLIEDGVVRQVAPALRPHLPESGIEVIRAHGRWVLPGIVDMHVHLREPGREEDETIESGTRAAALGGVTTVLCMPNTLPPVDNPDKVGWVAKRAKETAWVRVQVAGAVTVNQAGEELAPLGGMADAGAIAFTDDGKPVSTAGFALQCLERSHVHGTRLIEHCEDPSLSNGGCMNAGPVATAKGLKGIPNSSESALAARDIEVLRRTRGKLHLAHISTAETLGLLRRAKEDGLDVTGEVCPHHFTLADEDIPELDTRYKMNPPLRSRADVEALQRAIAGGLVDVIATDHAPHAAEKKAKPFAEAPFGIIGLETLVPLSLSLVRAGLLTPLRWAHLLTAGPAAVLGLRGAGTLAPGSVADLVVVAPDLEHRMDLFRSKSDNSPFRGKLLQGFATTTVIGGRVVMQDGELVQRPDL
ncbi:MAG: dihydroorotase [Deltaproteobacteria bacterium]|nr:dihydroorotase [Deltaproteobacteria bacterium]